MQKDGNKLGGGESYGGMAVFEVLVEKYYQPLYRFAFSLARNEAEAGDLTQQTFYRWAQKGHQLRDKSKVKTWLFTTLHREFLGSRRRQTRFQHQELETAAKELPVIKPEIVKQLDGDAVVEMLSQVDELYRVPVMLFYLEEHSYQEMAEILDVPLGTVMSRLARGKQQLRRLIAEAEQRGKEKIISVSPETWRKEEHRG